MLEIFVTGTDSNVGKTFISAGLAATMQSLGYSTCVYKPVQTGTHEKNGFTQSPDLAFVKNIDPYIQTHSTYMLKESAPPVVAAESEKIFIDKNFIKKDYALLSKEQDCVITEGIGGITTPLAPNFILSDLVASLDLPVIVVVNAEFSTANQTILTINHAQSKGIKVRGVVINNFPHQTDDINLKTMPRLIEEYSDVKVLGVVQSFKDTKKINPNDLITTILNGIDIESVFDVKIAKLDVD